MKWRLIKYVGLTAGIFMLLGINAFPVLASSAELSIQTDQIAVGDSVQFSITVTGGSLSIPQPGIVPIDGLDIRYLGPSTQIQIINGRTSTMISHNYVLTAVKPGSYTLGPFEMTDGSRKLETNAIQLTIAKAASGNQNPSGNGSNNATESTASSDSQLFLNFTVPKTKIYWGEQIPVTFRLYIGDVRIQGAINSLGFDQPQISLDQLKKTGERQETINGQTYDVVEFSGVLTPVKTGTFTRPR